MSGNPPLGYLPPFSFQNVSFPQFANNNNQVFSQNSAATNPQSAGLLMNMNNPFVLSQLMASGFLNPQTSTALLGQVAGNSGVSNLTSVVPPTKRRRVLVSVACVACRKAHASCSAERPCRRCAVRGIDCIDDPTVKVSSKKREASASDEVLDDRDDEHEHHPNDHGEEWNDPDPDHHHDYEREHQQDHLDAPVSEHERVAAGRRHADADAEKNRKVGSTSKPVSAARNHHHQSDVYEALQHGGSSSSSVSSVAAATGAVSKKSTAARTKGVSHQSSPADGLSDASVYSAFDKVDRSPVQSDLSGLRAPSTFPVPNSCASSPVSESGMGRPDASGTRRAVVPVMSLSETMTGNEPGGSSHSTATGNIATSSSSTLSKKGKDSDSTSSSDDVSTDLKLSIESILYSLGPNSTVSRGAARYTPECKYPQVLPNLSKHDKMVANRMIRALADILLKFRAFRDGDSLHPGSIPPIIGSSVLPASGNHTFAAAESLKGMEDVLTRLIDSLAFQSLKSQIENNFDDVPTTLHPGFIAVFDRNATLIAASKDCEYWSGKTLSLILNKPMPLASNIPDERLDETLRSWFTCVENPRLILRRSVDISLRGELLHGAVLFLRDKSRIARLAIACYVPVRDIDVWKSRGIGRAEDWFLGEEFVLGSSGNLSRDSQGALL
eukprot:ANDGO_05588.mRNA.1 hypothetical protein